MKKAIQFFGISLIVIIHFFSASAQQNPEVDALKKYLKDARVKWNVPALSVGIIHNDTIVLLDGFGEREVGTGKTVNGNTLFAVASNTKAFTATALGMLVDEGKLRWDDKVVDYLPWFRLYDPYVSTNMTIRDLLTHRSGLATFSGDLIWYGSTYSRQEIIKRAALLKPVYGFRSNYGYSNIMYLTAGEIIKAISGQPWEDFVQHRILDPLGMTNTLTSTTQLNNVTNVAMPHNDVGDDVIRISYLNWDNIAPAGALISSSADMLKWLKFQLHNGKIGDSTLVKTATMREMQKSQTVMNISAFSEKLWPSTHFKTYGLGWSLMDYHGRKIISHSGGYDGMISFSGFVPEENLGFVILTNKNSSLYYPLSFKILDAFLSDDTTDWSTNFYNIITQNEAAEKQSREEEKANRIKGTSPTLPLEDYAGTYTSEIYGDVVVELKNKELSLRFVQTPMFHSPLRHWQYNTFEIKFPEVPSLPEGKAAFVLNMDSKVHQLLIDVPNPDFDFTEFNFIKNQ
ncbi:MAG: serine hydrolase [Lentimicrobium sp.]|jgi:CubicO group peptidase (beta-lactamase class C family)|nr:serine hydrolase [Lentimicrobium sp.]